jgi:putative phage-type endonuclease
MHQPIRVDLQQGTPDWLEFRKTKIGASEAASILGIGFKSPYELWQEKLGLSETVVNAAMRRGVENEPLAIAAFTMEEGVLVKPAVYVHPKYEWMSASLDGISSDLKVAVEVKCPGRIDHEIASNKKVPPKYIPQLQHQMEVMGLDEMFYLSYQPESTYCFKVYRDQKFIDNMIEKEYEFYECVQKLTAPFSENDHKRISNEEWIHASSQHTLSRDRRKRFEEEEEFWKNQLIQLSGQSNAMGNGIKLSKTVRKGSIDYSKIPELAQVDLEKYRGKSVEFWSVK